MVTLVLCSALAAGGVGGVRLAPVVEVEEDVYSYTPPNNGAGPMWTHGNTCLVRTGDTVLASGLETLPGHRPLNNVRWLLFRRGPEGWALCARGEGTHEREPCPLTVFPGGPVLLSTNPSACRPDEYDGPATPQVLEFALADLQRPGRTLVPVWDRTLQFHGHTYRSFAADASRREAILFYTIGYDRAYWTFLDAQGQWARQGSLEFPFGREYDEPQPIRVCYPTVALRGRAVYFCGVSDIVEPYAAWRQFKQELTGQKWDYDFRRLFFTWCEDISGGRFQDWVEVASRDRTCGWIMPCDLHVAPDGRVFLLWTERALDERLRPRFFPEARQSVALNGAILEKGTVVRRFAVQEWREGEASPERPGEGRFQVLPDGRLTVLYAVRGQDGAGAACTANRAVEVFPDGTLGEPATVPLKKPLHSFYTATPRAGCAPSATADLLGDLGGTLRYARVRLVPGIP